ncbi:MAG: hypothetical protein QM765_09585 [Myxococcales bacterium]
MELFIVAIDEAAEVWASDTGCTQPLGVSPWAQPVPSAVELDALLRATAAVRSRAERTVYCSFDHSHLFRSVEVPAEPAPDLKVCTRGLLELMPSPIDEQDMDLVVDLPGAATRRVVAHAHRGQEAGEQRVLSRLSEAGFPDPVFEYTDLALTSALVTRGLGMGGEPVVFFQFFPRHFEALAVARAVPHLFYQSPPDADPKQALRTWELLSSNSPTAVCGGDAGRCEAFGADFRRATGKAITRITSDTGSFVLDGLRSRTRVWAGRRSYSQTTAAGGKPKGR